MKKCKRTILLVISILMMSMIAGCGFGEVEIKINSDEDKNYHEILTPTRGIDAHKDGIDTQLQPCSNDIVRTVINAYYNALVEKDKTKLSELVTAPINLTDDLFLKYNDVEEIKVKHIYTINGKAPVDFIVYAYYEIYFQGISTPLPSLDEMYLTDVGGNISIINGNIMMDDYNYAVSLTRDNSGVNDLVNSVNIIFNEAINKDVTLKSKIEPLKPEIIVPDEDTGSEDD